MWSFARAIRAPCTDRISSLGYAIVFSLLFFPPPDFSRGPESPIPVKPSLSQVPATRSVHYNHQAARAPGHADNEHNGQVREVPEDDVLPAEVPSAALMAGVVRRADFDCHSERRRRDLLNRERLCHGLHGKAGAG